MAVTKYNHRFSVRRQSAAQKTHLKKFQAGRSGHHEPKATSSTSRRKVAVLVPLTPPGGHVDQATLAELDAAHMRTTNDVCEGTLGSTIRAKARSPAKTLRMINASAVHKQNNTEAFKAAHTAEELEKFVRRKAHEEDTGHALQEVRAEHARVQKKSERKEASRKACKAKRTARDNVLEQLKIHLEPAFWDNSTAARQPTVKDISLQLSWLRVPSRGVKVPAGLSKARRTELVRALMEVL